MADTSKVRALLEQAERQYEALGRTLEKAREALSGGGVEVKSGTPLPPGKPPGN